MRNPVLFFVLFTSLILIIDFFTYKGIKRLIEGYKDRTKKIILYVYLIIPVILIPALLIFAIFNRSIDQASVLVYFHYLSGTFMLFYIPKLVFLIFNLMDELVHLIRVGIKKLQHRKIKESERKHEEITRRQFLTRAGIVIAGLPFISIIYGIKWGRFDFTVRRLPLIFPNLPESFNGLKILQISDFHLGSLIGNESEVEEAVEIINKENADFIFFTGDIVNNLSGEIDNFISILKYLRAKKGMYSILGNHDYADYVPWRSTEAKKENLERLLSIQEEIGFKMLLNESEKISINGEAIELVGVENWGLPPFPQYGDLKKALSKTEKKSFKILLSHDPTHWDEEVLEKTDIDLTLSGHTHGAQFGIEIPEWRWSPVSMRYKRWGGLYVEGKQALYVNTGIGYIGFPGRIGMPPEITVIELRNS